MFWRSAVALIPICLYMVWRKEFPGTLRTRRPWLHVTRSLLGAVSMGASFLSLAYLPVANAQALAYLAPVLVLPLAALLLRETLTSSVVIAVLLGFCGVLFLLWDAFAVPGEGAIIGVLAGLAYAFTMAFVRVHTKTMTLTESSSSIAFYFAIVSALVGLGTLPLGWIPLDGRLFGWLMIAGLLGGVGHIVSNEAVARAPVGALAPFEFTGLIWALGFDLLIFSTVPGGVGIAGAVAITLAALMVSFFVPPSGRSAR